jgi:hypothetical protein
LSGWFGDYQTTRYTAFFQLRSDTSFEHSSAAEERPLDRCLEDVRGCDVYVGIFGRRYGFIPPGQTESITALEYREAVKHGIYRICCFLDDAVQLPADYEDEDRSRIDAFRSEIQQEVMACFFKSPLELAVEVLSSLNARARDASRVYLHIAEPAVRVPQWSEFAEIPFSITNRTDQAVKLVQLDLEVLDRQPYDEFRLQREGAPIPEFEIRADIREADRIGLLAGLGVQFVTSPGESEAIRLIVACDEGLVHHCRLHAAVADIRTGERRALDAADFSITRAIVSVGKLRERRGEGQAYESRR